MSTYQADPLYITAASFLSLSSSPENLLKKTLATYDRLKKEFRSSKYIAFTALLLEALDLPDDDLENRIKRGKVIYDCLKSRHMLLTDSNDAALSLLLADTEKNIEDVMTEIESTYKLLKPIGSNEFNQLIAMILTCSDKPQDDKTLHFVTLYQKLQTNKPKFRNSSEMLYLAVLSLLTDDTEAVVKDIYDVFNELEDREGYKGFFARYDNYTQLLHTILIVLADTLSAPMCDFGISAVFMRAIYKFDLAMSNQMI